jgi:major membrane immunogen (membrane-anchored lipoprotein)
MILSKYFLITALLFYSCGSTEEDATQDVECKFNDGTYSADVEYTNPDTGYNTTYTLDVEVKDCDVVQIDFPNGGYLDNDHIDPTNIDADGNASIEDDRGRTFDVHIEMPDEPNDPESP